MLKEKKPFVIVKDILLLICFKILPLCFEHAYPVSLPLSEAALGVLFHEHLYKVTKNTVNAAAGCGPHHLFPRSGIM